jgi:hypothetical protein
MKTPYALALAAILAIGLVGCTDTGASGGDTDDTTSSGDAASTDTDDSGFAGVTLAGTGSYAVPDEAPIGGYELPNDQDGQPDGCTWTLYLDDGSVFVENTGSFVFLTDVTATFETTGCPDWVQFQ